MEGKKVLVIDDEPSMHRLIQVILENEGFQIVGLEGDVAASQSFAKGKPDVIILDIMMPEVSGFDILEVLKGDEETSGIPVIILTVRNLEEDIEKAMSLGADLYLTKPFQPAELLDAINSVLSGGEAGPEAE